jgi:hypothetical protein
MQVEIVIKRKKNNSADIDFEPCSKSDHKSRGFRFGNENCSSNKGDSDLALKRTLKWGPAERQARFKNDKTRRTPTSAVF